MKTPAKNLIERKLFFKNTTIIQRKMKEKDIEEKYLPEVQRALDDSSIKVSVLMSKSYYSKSFVNVKFNGISGVVDLIADIGNRYIHGSIDENFDFYVSGFVTVIDENGNKTVWGGLQNLANKIVELAELRSKN